MGNTYFLRLIDGREVYIDNVFGMELHRSVMDGTNVLLYDENLFVGTRPVFLDANDVDTLAILHPDNTKNPKFKSLDISEFSLKNF